MPAIWRKLADRVGVRRISCQQCSLTTATAKIDFSLRTTLARLGHPFRSAKPVETFRFEGFRQLNHFRQAIDVAPVNDEIETERNAGSANFRSNVQLALMRARAGDFVGQVGLVGLET